ncbi:MAG: DNA recombination protein RmuC [Candidatus Binatia bacterium]|nr:DNA recombination protein RmuC [Candidatus Binatia bacterium]
MLWAILALAVANLGLIVFILVRLNAAKTGAADQIVREELRAGREEQRAAASELRKELQAGLNSSLGVLRESIAAVNQAQAAQFETLTNSFRQNAEVNQTSIEQMRNTIDARIKELREGNEQKISEMRSEVSEGLRSISERIAKTLEELGATQKAQLETIGKQLKELTESNQTTLERIRTTFDERMREFQEGNEKRVAAMRQEVSDGLKAVSDNLAKTLADLGNTQRTQLESMTKQLKDLGDSNQATLERVRATLDERIKELQLGNEKQVSAMRQEVSEGVKTVSESVTKTLSDLGTTQRLQLEAMTKQLKELGESNQAALDRIRGTFDQRIKEMQEGNERKLEEMRKTVDEKLHDTLEKRLGESFKLVSERLEVVHRGLGEMQNLANGVGELKRVLSNVKVRGTWAEVQLGAILEQILDRRQFEKNVRIKGDSAEAVEYAIRLPGPKEEPNSVVWLPIDSKFPQEDYLRLQEAAERGDADAVQQASEALARTVRLAAKDIRDKYVDPPHTTDFAIMFLATEGLYAEVLRHPALVEQLLQEYRIVVAGPTTLAAILSSLRMGFRTLAIEQRAAEVWKVLGAVKTEFGKFGQVLDKVKRQLNTATRTIEETGVRTRAMERRLRAVEELPEEEAHKLLEIPASFAAQDVEDELA